MTKFTPIQQQLLDLNAVLRDEVTPRSVPQKGQRIWLIDRSRNLVRSLYAPSERLPLFWELPVMRTFDPIEPATDYPDLTFRTRTFVRRWIEVSATTALASKEYFIWPYEWPYDEPVYMERL